MGLMAAVFATVWYVNRRIPGLGAWALSYLSGFLFCLDIAARPYLPEVMSVVVAQVGMLLMAYLCLVGCHAYMKRPPLAHRYAAAYMVASVSLSVYFTVGQPHLGARFVIVSLGLGVLFLLAARTLATGGLRRYPARYLTALACGGHGLFLLGRPLLFRVAGGAHAPISTGSAISAFVIIESIVVLNLIGFGLLMLVNEFVTVELRRLAYKDPLTGVFNRRAFLTLLDKATSLASRMGGTLPVLAIDLDHFKKINDTWGHQRGDEALCHFVGVATACLRKPDVIGRMGGEEFAIFLPNTTFDDACVVAERLRTQLAAQPLNSTRGPISLTASIGVTLCGQGESTEIALGRADAAMYRAKEAGRNRVEVASAVSA